MAIEITSVSGGASSSLSRIVRVFQSFLHVAPLSTRQILFRSTCGLIAFLLVIGGDALLKSYKYYSRIVDARLASGYLVSRPGLYAAPRIIQTGQKLSRPDLIRNLRRAGYVELKGSNVWNGSFRETDSGVEVRPNHIYTVQPSLVHIKIDGNHRIAELTGDGVSLESFKLEPEVLSNDSTSKVAKNESLSYSTIPPVLVHAILSIEDQRFFQHSGVDPLAIARALLRNADEERIGQGGSTITQQLVKNTYLSPERSLRRKYAEAMLSFALERRLSKQDIFALYCSEVYLGQRGAVAVRGVKEGARIYFGKEMKDLSLAEAATLAGMIQGPARYSPLNHPEEAKARRNLVIEAMAREGYINLNEAAAAREAGVECVAQGAGQSLAPYFVDYVNRTSDSQFETSSATQRIYTTIDLELQQLAESAIKRQLDRLDARYKTNAARPQAALVALDPKTGNVLAMIGGRNYAESQLNRATDARRQPGSTFKPFVYAAALEDGMSPVQTFEDAPREFVYDRNKLYRPANFGGGYSMREVTMRTGLVNSLNVVTVDVALRTGLARIANLAQQFGLPRPERYPALALGTKEVTPLELAAAYATFVNGGRRVQPKVVESVGEPPAIHESEDKQAQVISPTTSYMITNMLAAVVDHGTARSARDAVKGSAIAGKTGTSRDGWFVGYTQNLVCVVWIGFDDNRQLGLTGSEAALPAWIDFVKGAVELRPELGGRNFECPEGIKFVEIDAESGAISTLTCPHRELIAVTDRLAPNIECFLHGNLPFQEERPEANEFAIEQAVATHHSQVLKPLPRNPVSASAETRVDIDARGVRRLVNDMR